MLLIVIFLLFIGNGLPNSLLGAAWTAISASTGAPLNAAGTISMVMMAGPIISNLFIAKWLRRFPTERLALFGVALSISAIAGFGMAKSAVWLYILAVPLGFGMGILDAAISLYVAARYGARQINWLNCSWGVGAMTGPVIMSFMLKGGRWQTGYFIIAALQLVIAVIFAFSTPLWRKVAKAEAQSEAAKPEGQPLKDFAKMPVFKSVIACIMLYFGVELGFGLWGGSYLTIARGMDAAQSAMLVSAFYAAITIGRFASGVLTAVISSKNMIRIGMAGMIAGLFLLYLPGIGMAGFIVYGLGCAPVFPCTLHEMKVRFGEADAAAHLGVVLGISRLGLAVFPEIIGKAATGVGFSIFLPMLLGLCFIMFALSELSNKLAVGKTK